MPIEDWEPWFARNRKVLEAAYLAKMEPWAQLGMSGPFERWRALRKPVADCKRQEYRRHEAVQHEKPPDLMHRGGGSTGIGF